MKKGFTLVELLVVTGILAILIAVLVPALSGSSESAKAVKCLSNLHSLAMGVHGYAMEYNRFPMAASVQKYKGQRQSDGVEVVPGWIGWGTTGTSGEYISPYNDDPLARENSMTNGAIWKCVGCNHDVYVCPAHKERTRKKLGSRDKFGPCWSYAMSSYFGYDNRNGRPFSTDPRILFEAVADKSKVLLFAELPYIECDGQNGRIDTTAGEENDPLLRFPRVGDDGNEAIGFNHKMGKREIYAHVCYADGHTEKFRLPRSASESELKKLTTWLCYPRNKEGDKDKAEKPFDIMQSNGKYEAVDE